MLVCLHPIVEAVETVLEKMGLRADRRCDDFMVRILSLILLFFTVVQVDQDPLPAAILIQQWGRSLIVTICFVSLFVRNLLVVGIPLRGNSDRWGVIWSIGGAFTITGEYFRA